MKVGVFYILMLLTGCTLLKEKHRVQLDSLSVSKSSSDWTLKQEWRLRETQMDTIAAVQELFITADAPFKWQADSGLWGGAGTYRLKLKQQGRFLTEKTALTKGEHVGQQAANSTSTLKSLALEQRTPAVTLKAQLLFCLGLLLLLGLLFLGRKR